MKSPLSSFIFLLLIFFEIASSLPNGKPHLPLQALEENTNKIDEVEDEHPNDNLHNHDSLNTTNNDQFSLLTANHANDGIHAEENHGDDNHSKESHEHHGIHVASIKFNYVQKPFILSMFMLVVVIAKIGFHHADFLSGWMPESCILILLGLVVGAILHVLEVDTSSFYYIDPKFFFLFLLPPCILEAAYGLHDRVFFNNLGTIIVYAVLGTMINCFLVGSMLFGIAYYGAMGKISITFIQCLVFSSLIVAVDPVAVLAIFQEIGVNSVLYFLVFGESLLNDAVTVVLYNTITTLNRMEGSIPLSEIGMAIAAFFTVSLGGLLIGVIYGIITALVTRLTFHVKVVEPLAVLSLSYSSYLTAELFHFSGIISLIACGLIQMQYAFHNISSQSHITIKHFIKMLSMACDCIIFMFLGIAVVRDKLVWHTGFILWTVFLCLFIRFLVTYGLTFVLNRTKRKRLIGTREQFIMAYGGLRGAVAFCLVAMLDESEHKDLFRTTTIVIVFFTVFFQGITIKPLVKCLKIEGEEKKIVSLYHEINSHVMDHVLMYMEELIGHYGYNTIQGFLNNLNDKYMKKLLQRDPLTKDELIMEVYKQIAVQQHYESVYGYDNSSQLNIYKPELIPNKSVAVGMRKYSQHAAASSVLANRLHRKLTRAELEINEDLEESFDINLFKDFNPPDNKKNEAKKRCVSESENVFLEVRRPENKWKAASKKIRRLSEKSETCQKPMDLRKLLDISSQREICARQSKRLLLDADDKDLWDLLKEKQRRHTRYMINHEENLHSKVGSEESLDNSNKFQRQEMYRRNKSFEFDNNKGVMFASRLDNYQTSDDNLPLEKVPLKTLKEEESTFSEKPTEIPDIPSDQESPKSAFALRYQATFSKQPIKTQNSVKNAQNSSPHHSTQHLTNTSPQTTKPPLPHSPKRKFSSLHEANIISSQGDVNNKNADPLQKRGSFMRQKWIQNTSEDSL